VKVPPQGVVTSKQTSHRSGLSPIKGQKSSLGTQAGSRDHFSSLFMCVRKASPSRPVMFCQPASVSLMYFPSRDSQGRLCLMYFPSRGSQGRLVSIEPQSRTALCELIGNLITSYSGMPREPGKPNRVPGRDVIQCPLALLYQMRGSDDLKSFQGRLTIRADAHISPWSILKLNFISTGQDSIYFGLENRSLSSQGKTEPPSHRLPIDSSLGPVPHPGPVCKPYESFDCRRSASSCCPSAFVSIVTLYLGSRLNAGLITSTPMLNKGSDC